MGGKDRRPLLGRAASSVRGRPVRPALGTANGDRRAIRNSPAVRPRFSHTSATTASISAALHVGKQRRRFRRARLLTARRGPSQRATLPPRAEAWSRNNRRMPWNNSQVATLRGRRSSGAPSPANLSHPRSWLAPSKRDSTRPGYYRRPPRSDQSPERRWRPAGPAGSAPNLWRW